MQESTNMKWKVYDTVLKKFDENVIYERVRQNQL